MNGLWNFIVAHWAPISAAAIYTLVAARATMPPPGTRLDGYQWFYDFTGVLVNQHSRPSLPAETPGNPKQQ
jgi:hypothetical protein